jgi:hypothetical protein
MQKIAEKAGKKFFTLVSPPFCGKKPFIPSAVRWQVSVANKLRFEIGFSSFITVQILWLHFGAGKRRAIYRSSAFGLSPLHALKLRKLSRMFIYRMINGLTSTNKCQGTGPPLLRREKRLTR